MVDRSIGWSADERSARKEKDDATLDDIPVDLRARLLYPFKQLHWIADAAPNVSRAC